MTSFHRSTPPPMKRSMNTQSWHLRCRSWFHFVDSLSSPPIRKQFCGFYRFLHSCIYAHNTRAHACGNYRQCVNLLQQIPIRDWLHYTYSLHISFDFVLYIYMFLRLRVDMTANIYIPKFSSRMLQKNKAIGLNFTW